MIRTNGSLACSVPALDILHLRLNELGAFRTRAHRSAAHFDTKFGGPDAHQYDAELTDTVTTKDAISYSLLALSRKSRVREHYDRDEAERSEPRVTLQISSYRRLSNLRRWRAPALPGSISRAGRLPVRT